MTVKIQFSSLVCASVIGMGGVVISLVGCGGGSSGPATSQEPLSALPIEVAPPVVTPNPPTLMQPIPSAPVIPTTPVAPPATPVTPVTPVIPVTPVTPVMPVVPGLVAPSASITSANSCGLVNFQTDMMRAVNAARAQARFCGSELKPAVASISWNETLFVAATAHSQDMAQRNYFAHTSPQGSTAGDRAQSVGYRFSNLGENIAAGQPSVDVVMAGWLASAGHCNNIMSASFSEVAVACVTTSRPVYPTYWTMMLGKRL